MNRVQNVLQVAVGYVQGRLCCISCCGYVVPRVYWHVFDIGHTSSKYFVLSCVSWHFCDLGDTGLGHLVISCG